MKWKIAPPRPGLELTTIDTVYNMCNTAYSSEMYLLRKRVLNEVCFEQNLQHDTNT